MDELTGTVEHITYYKMPYSLSWMTDSPELYNPENGYSILHPDGSQRLSMNFPKDQ